MARTCVISSRLGTALLCLWFWWPDNITPAQQTGKAAIRPGNNGPANHISEEPQPGEAEYPRYFLDQRKIDPLWDFKRPIEFYGRVVDEEGNPVGDMGVHFSWNDLSPQGTSTNRTTTDALGRFSLTGVSGKVAVIRLDDSEYNIYWKTNQFAFEYANPYLPSFHIPNPNQPVIFHVQKKRESAPLITGRAKITFLKNGQPTKVNLMSGKESSDGQLQVQVWAGARDERGRYDWKVSLKTSQGGFKETLEEFPSEAPPSGYETAMEFTGSASSPEWRPSLEKQFYYVVGAPPRYGRMELSVKIYAGRYYVDYFFNPTGERNLVYDPLRDLDLP